jgi:protein tyrosine/serine phosphatase
MPPHRLAHVLPPAGITLAAFILIGTLPCTPAHAGETNAPAPSRPATWAVKLDRPGLMNFYQLNTNFYRGAQPSADGVQQLKSLGVRTDVDLRAFHSDTQLVAGSGLKQARLHMRPWHAEDEDVIAFLKIAMNTNNLPLFVHCKRGADRTGMVCAMYRIVVCGWTKEQALDEMKNGGFDFWPGWKNIVRYIEQVDVDRIRREVARPEKVEALKR